MNKENIQINNAELLDPILSTILAQKTEDECKVGQYVWEKYTPREITYTNPSIFMNGTTDNGTVSSTIVDLDIVDEKFFDGFANSGGAKFVYTDKLYWTWNTSPYPASYNPQTKKIIVSGFSGTYTTNEEYKYTGTKKVIIKENLEYVLDDNSGKYPIDGELNGYHYTLITDYTQPSRPDGIDFGEVTLLNQADSITVEHSLEVIPSLAILVSQNSGSVEYHTFLNVGSSKNVYWANGDVVASNSTNVACRHSGSFCDRQANTVRFTKDTVNGNTLYGFLNGTYRWIVISQGGIRA